MGGNCFTGVIMRYHAEDGREVIQGQGAIDYITLTTYNREQMFIVENVLSKLFPNGNEKKKIEGYYGIQYTDFAFLGHGTQNKEDHHYFSSTGYNSDFLTREIIKQDGFNIELWNCSRIDIQVTIPTKKRRMRLTHIGEELEKGKYGKLSNRREIKFRYWGNPTGDSLYLGSPKSEKQIRIYDKKVYDDNEQEYKMERYEIQLRRKTSLNAFRKIASKGEGNVSKVIESLIRGDINNLPDKLQKKLSSTKWKPNVTPELITRAHTVKKESDTTRWIKTNMNAFARACKQDGKNGIDCRMIMLRAIVAGIDENEMNYYYNWRVLNPDGEIYDIEKWCYTPDSVSHETL